MSRKSKDHYGNWRNVTIGFRVTVDQYNRIVILARLERKDKRAFIRDKLAYSQIRCIANPKAYKTIEPYYMEAMERLKILALIENQHKEEGGDCYEK